MLVTATVVRVETETEIIYVYVQGAILKSLYSVQAYILFYTYTPLHTVTCRAKLQLHYGNIYMIVEK